MISVLVLILWGLPRFDVLFPVPLSSLIFSLYSFSFVHESELVSIRSLGHVLNRFMKYSSMIGSGTTNLTQISGHLWGGRI